LRGPVRSIRPGASGLPSEPGGAASAASCANVSLGKTVEATVTTDKSKAMKTLEKRRCPRFMDEFMSVL
jgi:hypothetical protein